MVVRTLKKLSMLLFLFVVQSNLGAQDYKRLVILFDENSEGPTIDKKNALAITFAINIHQKAAPAIVSHSVAQAFLGLKYDYVTNPPTPSVAHSPEENAKFLDIIAFFKLITFNQNDWNIYHCQDSQLFLFVPVAMALVIDAETVMVDGSPFPVAGFKLGKPEQLFQSTTPDVIGELRTWMKDKSKSAAPVAVSQLKSLLFNDDDILKVPGLRDKLKKVTEEEQGTMIKERDDVKISAIRSHTKPWNIFMQGHGSYGEQSTYADSIAGLSPKKFQELLLFFNRINTNIVALSSCYSGGKNLDYIKVKDELASKKITPKIHYILAVISSGDSPSTIVTEKVFATTTASDFDPASSFNLESFFATCESRASVNWLTDALRYLARSGEYESAVNVPQILIPNGGWFQAFSSVSIPLIVEDAEKEIAKINQQLLDPKKLTDMQKIVAENRKESLDEYLSQERVFPVSPIQIIGNMLLMKHQLENSKPIQIKEKSVVLLYPAMIPVTIQIAPTKQPTGTKPEFKFPMILSMEPGDAVQVLANVELSMDAGLQAFIQDSFFTIKDRRAKKTFLIQNLEGKNDFTGIGNADEKIVLNNVLIHSWTDVNNNVHRKLFFQKSDKTYWELDEVNSVSELILKGSNETVFNKAVAELNPKLPNLVAELKAYKKPEWSKIPPLPQLVKPPVATLADRIFDVRHKLGGLHFNLKRLKKKLEVLREKLVPLPLVPPIVVSKPLQICSDLVQAWQSGSKIMLGEDFDKDLALFALTLSRASIDQELDFIDEMLQKLDKPKQQVLLSNLAKRIHKDKDISQAPNTHYEFAALSIALFLNLGGVTDTPELQIWGRDMHNYYTRYVVPRFTTDTTLKKARSLDHLVAQLCKLFVQINYKGVSDELCAWVGKVLPMLPMSPLNRIKMLLAIIQLKKNLPIAPRLELLVDGLKANPEIKKAAQSVDQSKFNDQEKAWINYCLIFQPLQDTANALQLSKDLIDTWKDGNVQKITPESVHTFGNYLSYLSTDEKFDLVDKIRGSLSLEKKQTLCRVLFDFVIMGRNFVYNQNTFVELLALSIALWDEISPKAGSFTFKSPIELHAKQAEHNKKIQWMNTNNAQNWFNSVGTYYHDWQALFTPEHLKEASAKNLHYGAAQLCIFFAAIKIGGMYQALYIWIKDVLAVLQMSDDHKLEVVKAILSYSQANAATPEFVALVQTLKAQYPAAATPTS